MTDIRPSGTAYTTFRARTFRKGGVIALATAPSKTNPGIVSKTRERMRSWCLCMSAMTTDTLSLLARKSPMTATFQTSPRPLHSQPWQGLKTHMRTISAARFLVCYLAPDKPDKKEASSRRALGPSPSVTCRKRKSSGQEIKGPEEAKEEVIPCKKFGPEYPDEDEDHGLRCLIGECLARIPEPLACSLIFPLKCIFLHKCMNRFVLVLLPFGIIPLLSIFLVSSLFPLFSFLPVFLLLQ